MPRLHVKKITSIGVVEEGDNEPARILLWKSAPKPPKPLPVVQWANVEKALRVRDEELSAVIDRIDAAATAVNERNTMRRQAEIGPEGVRGEIDRIAWEMVAKGEAATLTEARPMAWRDNPDLIARSRQQHVSTPVSETGQTVADRIGQVVRDAADRAVRKSGVLWTEWGRDQQQARVRSQARVAAWRTEEGRLLRDLATAHGGAPYPSGVAKIRKRRDGDQFAKALRVLDAGFDL
jgi:hypothetical protein